jgi:hypothetical protein
MSYLCLNINYPMIKLLAITFIVLCSSKAYSQPEVAIGDDVPIKEVKWPSYQTCKGQEPIYDISADSPLIFTLFNALSILNLPHLACKQAV